MNTTKTYNPTNVAQYAGKTFVTENGSKYSVTEDGRFTGRESIEGGKIRAITGLPNDFLRSATIKSYLAEHNEDGTRRSIDDLKENAGELVGYLQKEGQELVKGRGLALCLVLEDSDIERTHRIGFKSSSIADII